MMNKMILAAACTLFAINLFAQDTSKDQQVVYKWYENGIAHYAKNPPRGINNYSRINQYGMVIRERQDIDSSQVIKPVRPVGGKSDNGDSSTIKEEAQEQAQTMPKGAILKDERCEMMTKELTALETKEDIYQEDESGNLIPLDNKDVEKRKQELKDSLTRICDG